MMSSTRIISILDHIAIAVPRTSRLMFPFRLIRSMYREDLKNINRMIWAKKHIFDQLRS